MHTLTYTLVSVDVRKRKEKKLSQFSWFDLIVNSYMHISIQTHPYTRIDAQTTRLLARTHAHTLTRTTHTHAHTHTHIYTVNTYYIKMCTYYIIHSVHVSMT